MTKSALTERIRNKPPMAPRTSRPSKPMSGLAPSTCSQVWHVFRVGAVRHLIQGIHGGRRGLTAGFPLGPGFFRFCSSRFPGRTGCFFVGPGFLPRFGTGRFAPDSFFPVSPVFSMTRILVSCLSKKSLDIALPYRRVCPIRVAT